MYIIDNILFDGPISWLEKADIPTDKNFSEYIYSIDWIDQEIFYTANSFIFHISVFSPDELEYIGTYCVPLPLNVDFMILEDTWDSDKRQYIYDPYQNIDVHRFYNVARDLYPSRSTFHFQDNKYVINENYKWSNAGRRYFIATLDSDSVKEIKNDTIFAIALDAMTYEVISFCTFGEAFAHTRERLRKSI